MQVKFTMNAQVRGRGFRRGDVTVLDDETAKQYCRAGQAVPYTEPPVVAAADDDADDSDDDDENEPGDADRETANRSGKRAQTAAKRGGTKR